MFTSFVLSLREGIEASLIIGILYSTLQKLERPDLKSQLWSGTILALIGSGILAGLLNQFQMEFDGKNEMVFEGITLLVTAGLLAWVLLWMSTHASTMGQNLKAQVANSLNGRAMFATAFFAVIREGLELVLFLAAIKSTQQPVQTATGAFLGLLFAAILGWLIINSTIKLDLNAFFRVTNAAILILAAGMVGAGIHELNEAGIIPGIISPLWNLNWLIPEGSIPGQFLRSLFGYIADPSLTVVLGYLLFTGAILSRRPFQKANK